MCVHSPINTNKKDIINLTQNSESYIDILNSCPYMEWEDIRNSSPETVDLKIMHFSVHSIIAKQTELKELLNGLYTENLDMDAILLCEKYLNTCMQNLVDFSRFNLMCKNRTKKKNGDVAILFKDHFNYTKWEDIFVFKERERESVFIDIHFKKGPDITLGSVYSVPGTSTTRYISQIKQLVNKIQETKNEIVIGTDQNIDFLKINNINHALISHNTLMS